MTGPPPFSLAILPLGPAFDDLWELAIKPACAAAGAYAERLDAQLSPEAVLQRIQNLIAKADLVIADMTERRENIFYTAGYAHALDKQAILLTRDERDIPFDLKHYPHVEYAGITDLRPELERRARYLLDAAMRGDAPLATPVEIRVNGVELLPGTPAPVKPDDEEQPNDIGFWVIVRNEAGWRRRTANLQLALIAPSHYSKVSDWSGVYTEAISLDGGMRLHLSPQQFRILPGSWERALFRAHTSQPLEAHRGEELAIRVLTETGVFDFPFTLG